MAKSYSLYDKKPPIFIKLGPNVRYWADTCHTRHFSQQACNVNQSGTTSAPSLSRRTDRLLTVKLHIHADSS